MHFQFPCPLLSSPLLSRPAHHFPVEGGTGTRNLGALGTCCVLQAGRKKNGLLPGPAHPSSLSATWRPATVVTAQKRAGLPPGTQSWSYSDLQTVPQVFRRIPYRRGPLEPSAFFLHVEHCRLSGLEVDLTGSQHLLGLSMFMGFL